MALSAVYRTGQRFGVNHLIDVLIGATTDKIGQFRHDQLKIWGVGSAIDANQWRSVFRQLVARGYLNVALERFGALCLEKKSRPLLRGEEVIEMRRDITQRASKQRTKTVLPTDIDVELWEALREQRRELADAQGVPPYVVFPDRSLQEMCVTLPRDMLQFAQIIGVGERKLAKYGPTFVALIDAHLGTRDPSTRTDPDD
jgi:ATP-dependent DNA helicase RecQ